MNEIIGLDEFIQWYKDKKDDFKDYAKYISNVIGTCLPDYKIFPARVLSREKSIESITQKCKKIVRSPDSGETVYKYTDPKNQLTDMAGVRIVTYTISEVPIVGRVIEKLFEIDNENSIDKRSVLFDDRIGYLSVHYIVSLKDSDNEYAKYEGMKCEIQVRTVLQDAWAQIFHDRQYKPFGMEDPSEDLKRETNLVAASLELLDTEIEMLVGKYDSFYKIPNNAEHQKFLDNTITRQSLLKYIDSVLGECYCYYDYEYIQKILSYFQINSIRDLDKIYNPILADNIKKTAGVTMDRIILCMIIARYPEEFFYEFHDRCSISNESKKILSQFININNYISE